MSDPTPIGAIIPTLRLRRRIQTEPANVAFPFFQEERSRAERLARILPDDWWQTEVSIGQGMRVDILSRWDLNDGPHWTVWELKVGGLHNSHLAQLRRYLRHLRPILGAHRLSGMLVGDTWTERLDVSANHPDEHITVVSYGSLWRDAA